MPTEQYSRHDAFQVRTLHTMQKNHISVSAVFHSKRDTLYTINILPSREAIIAEPFSEIFQIRQVNRLVFTQ